MLDSHWLFSAGLTVISVPQRYSQKRRPRSSIKVARSRQDVSGARATIADPSFMVMLMVLGTMGATTVAAVVNPNSNLLGVRIQVFKV